MTIILDFHYINETHKLICSAQYELEVRKNNASQHYSNRTFPTNEADLLNWLTNAAYHVGDYIDTIQLWKMIALFDPYTYLKNGQDVAMVTHYHASFYLKLFGSIVNAETFDDQINILRSHYKTISADDYQFNADHDRHMQAFKSYLAANQSLNVLARSDD